MKPNELKAIRAKLGLTQLQFGRALGIGGADLGCSSYVSQMENGHESVSEARARLARMYDLFGVPDKFK